MPSRMHQRVATSLFAIASLMIAGCGGGGSPAASTKAGVVTLGSIEHLTGSFGVRGTMSSQSVQLAADEINKAGGFKVGGTTYKLKVVSMDGKTDANTSVADATGLIRDDGINIIFGPVGVGALQVAQLTQQKGVLAFNPTGTTDALLTPDHIGANQLLFKSGPPLTVRIPIWDQAVVSFSPVPIKKAALIFSDDATTASTIGPIEQGLTAHGIQVTRILFPPATQDFSTFLEKARAFGADLLWLGYDPVSGLAMTRQAEQLGVGKIYAAASFPMSIAIKDAIGKPISKPFVVVYAGAQFEQPSSPRAKQVAKDYQALFGTPLAAKTASSDLNLYYDTVYELVAAMQKANSVTDLKAIATALESTKISGLGGPNVYFNSSHSLVNAIEACLVVDGKATCKTFAPT
jgi:branched-chain amino acid transport system substrate-binding protein